MTNWAILIEAGNELTKAFNLLDRAAEVGTLTTAAIITKTGLLDAAREAVARANRAMGR